MTEPARNKLVQAVDDMGEFQAEFPGNFNYRCRIVGTFFCGLCCVGMLPIMISGLLHFQKLAAEKPDDVPWYFWHLIVVMWCWVVFFGFMLIRVFFHNRRIPRLYALFENGLFMVRRNGGMEKIFWNEIADVKKHEVRGLFGKPTGKLRGVVVTTVPPDSLDPYSKPRTWTIPVEYIQNAEELCQRILSETESRNPPP